MEYDQLREILVNTESLYNIWQSTGLDEEAFILANRSIIEQTEKTRLQKAAAKARQIKFLEKQKANGKRFLSAMVSSETYDRLCLERDRSIKSGRPKNLGDVLDALLTGSKPPDKAENDEGLLTSKKLSENVKLLIGTYQKQKAESVGLDDTDGRYFAAGQVSALRLVLELIDAQKTQDRTELLDVF